MLTICQCDPWVPLIKNTFPWRCACKWFLYNSNHFTEVVNVSNQAFSAVGWYFASNNQCHWNFTEKINNIYITIYLGIILLTCINDLAFYRTAICSNTVGCCCCCCSCYCCFNHSVKPGLNVAIMYCAFLSSQNVLTLFLRFWTWHYSDLSHNRITTRLLEPHRTRFYSLAPGQSGCNFKHSNYGSITFSVWYIQIFLWQYHQTNATGTQRWKVNIGAGNGLVSSDIKPLPEPTLTQIYVNIWGIQAATS